MKSSIQVVQRRRQSTHALHTQAQRAGSGKKTEGGKKGAGAKRAREQEERGSKESAEARRARQQREREGRLMRNEAFVTRQQPARDATHSDSGALTPLLLL